MLPTNLKDELTKALSLEWPAFAQRHPHLAQALDAPLLVEQAAALLENDPAYRQAMDDAATAQTATDAILPVITRIVRQVLARLVG